MRISKIFRFFLIGAGMLLGCVLIFALASVIPIDRTPYQQQSFYKKMMNQLNDVQNISIPKPTREFLIGYAKVNLTPSFPVATAGYGNRKGKRFTAVHDSIFVRAMVIDNGVNRVAIVSADLLIIPPTVTELLEHQLSEIGFSLNNTYLGATHTHNSIGNWGEGAAEFLYGAYSDSIVYFIADKIKKSIVVATRNMMPATIKTGEIPVDAVRNRLDKHDGLIDSLVRVVEVHRNDSSKLIMLSYTAHATCLFSANLELSRDYPGQLVDNLEANGYSFAIFLAGAVGSHRCNPPEYGWPCIDWMAETIAKKLNRNKDKLSEVKDTSIMMVRVPLALGDPQFKILKNWRIRPWLFRYALGEHQSYLTALRIGKIVMLGMPCDFSGELTGAMDSLAVQKGLHVMITSFNGHYIGYITRDKYYDREHYETRLMNWYGPENGAYLTECALKMIDAVSY